MPIAFDDIPSSMCGTAEFELKHTMSAVIRIYNID